MKGKVVKWLLLFLVILLLVAPAFQKRYHIFSEKKLKGAVVPSPKPVFSLNSFVQEDYQRQLSDYLNNGFGFRSYVIRLNNDLDYRLFSIIHTQGIVIGKDGYLFEKGYIESLNGEDFIGKRRIRDQVAKLKFIQDTLEARGILLIVVIAPNKARFYSDFIPKKLNKRIRTSNYEFYSDFLKEEGLHFFDVGPWFDQLRDTCRYPLITKLGTHWSHYGMTLFADSLSKIIEQLNGKDLPEMHVSSVELVQSIYDLDYDLAKGMNLLSTMQQPLSANPLFTIDETAKWKPRTLAIADSYYWAIWKDSLAERYFSKPLFWYYFKTLYQNREGMVRTEKVNLKSELLQQDVVILIGTEFNLINFGWGFIEKSYAELKGITYNQGINEEKVREVERDILNNWRWLKAVTLKAQKRGIPLDSMIRIDAIYMVNRRQHNE